MAACVGDARRQPYQTFALCSPTGSGVWTIGAGDVRAVGGEGVFYDGSHLRSAREVDVAAAGASITSQLVQSDLDCCAGSHDGCIGLTLIVDAETGMVLSDRRHCIVC